LRETLITLCPWRWFT